MPVSVGIILLFRIKIILLLNSSTLQDHLREELQHYVKENARLQRKLEQQESATSYNVSGAASSSNPLHLGRGGGGLSLFWEEGEGA